MVEVQNKKTLLDKIITIRPTPRVQRLKEAFLRLKAVIELDNARIVTKVMKETEGEPMVIRRAESFAAVVRETLINIAPDELLVGYYGATRAGAPVMLEMSPALEQVLDYKGERGFIISDEDERELREEIFPYWKGLQGKWEKLLGGHYADFVPEEAANFILAEPTTFMETHLVKPSPNLTVSYPRCAIHKGHNVVNYEKVLEKGFLGVKKDAEDKLARIDYTNPDETSKIPFLKGVIIAMEAAAELGKRFADKARELAEREEDAVRKAELLKIAEVCDWVPANPARTFYEAIQAFWFTYILQYWETMSTKGISVGRMDQYLYPYYKNDIEEGRLTKEEVQELIDCFIMKLQTITWSPEDGHLYVVGDVVVSHLSVGGYKADGSDATNDLSFMFIEGLMHIRLPEPDLSVLVHSNMPDDLLIKGCQLAAIGYGQPMFQNSDVIITGLLSRGNDKQITLEDARNAVEVGCQEPFIAGMDGLTIHLRINLAASLEFVLNRGISHYYNKKIGVDTGDPRQFESFEEVREAWRKQIVWRLKWDRIASNFRELSLAEMHPTTFQSALIEDCIENGIPWEAGGARYNNDSSLSIALPDVANSFAVIKKLVFEEKKITMAQLCDALDHNFEGYEEIRKMCLEVPKYGNDDDYVDEQMVWATHAYATEVMRYKNSFGGRTSPNSQALYLYVPYGMVTGALPSGRVAGEPLSNGSSPCEGDDVNGPTAVLKSLGKVNNVELNTGTILNMSLDSAVFNNGDGFKRMADFMRTFIDEKIFHIQFNTIDADTLRAAQKEPEKYKDLIVRVAGYSAYFANLSREIQNEIIGRTEHKF